MTELKEYKEVVKEIAHHAQDFYRCPEHDISVLATAVYLILEQMTAEQTEPQCEKCKHFREEAEMYTHQCEFYFMECKYEPKTEPQTERSK